MNDPQTTATFASKLKREREALGISIALLSELCRITPEHLEKLESGQINITIDVFTDIVKIINLETHSTNNQPTDLAAQKRQALQQAALTELSKHEFITHGRTQKAIELITETLGKVLNVQFSGVWFFNEENDILKVVDEYILNRHVHEPKNTFSKKDFPKTFDRILNIHNRNLASKNKNEFLEIFSEFKEDHAEFGILSVLEATILSYDKVIGIISCDDVIERDWHPDETSFINQISLLITTTLHNEENLKLKNEIKLQRHKAEKQQEAIINIIKNEDVINGNTKKSI